MFTHDDLSGRPNARAPKDSFRAYNKSVTAEQARAAFVQQFGREPERVLDWSTIWAVGPLREGEG